MRTKPAGGLVKVDGEARADPAKFALLPGRYTILAELDGYRPESREVELIRNVDLVQEIAFTRRLASTTRPPSPVGKLTVRTTPYSVVFHNGRRLGETPFADLELPAGSYTLTFKHPQRGTVTRKVTITAGKTDQARLRVPVKPSLGQGSRPVAQEYFGLVLKWWVALMTRTVPDLRAHHDRLGLRAVAEEPDAVEEVALGDAGGGEHDVALRELLGAVDRVLGLDAHALGARALLVVAEPEPALELAADALERGRGDHALGRAAGAEQDVDAGVGVGRHDRAGDVAVADQADARAGLADLGDQVGCGDRGRGSRRCSPATFLPLALAIRSRFQVARLAQVDHAARLGADRDLLHVRVGRVEELAVVGDRDHADRVGRAGRAQVGALERVDRDVDLRRVVAGRSSPRRPSRR